MGTKNGGTITRRIFGDLRTTRLAVKEGLTNGFVWTAGTEIASPSLLRARADRTVRDIIFRPISAVQYRFLDAPSANIYRNRFETPEHVRRTIVVIDRLHGTSFVRPANRVYRPNGKTFTVRRNALGPAHSYIPYAYLNVWG